MNATDHSILEASGCRRPGTSRRPISRRQAFGVALLAALVLLGVLAGAANADIFWSSLPPFCFEATCESFVGHANQDGSGANSEFAAGAPHGLVQSGEYLYGTVGPSIGREKTDGTGLEPAFIVLPGAIKGATEYEGELTLSKLAVHGEYLYWASCHRNEKGPLAEGEIGRAKLNGTEVIPNFIQDNAGLGDEGSCIEDVAADAGHLYWTRNNGTIGRANLNGTAVELEFVKGVAGFVSGLAVNEHYIYWNTLFNAEIGRATISGAEVNNGFIKLARKTNRKGETGTPEDGGIAIYEGHLYWAEESTIGRANLDGSNVEESFIPSALAPPDGYINGLAVGSSPALQASISVTGAGGAPLTGANTTVGSTVEAKVTVSAPASDKGPVSVLAADPPLTVDPAPALKPVSGPLPSSIDGRSLAPGESFTYTDIYTIATTGHADLSVEVTGQYSGSPTSAQASQTAALGQPLEVSVGWLSSPGGPPLVLNQAGQPPLPNTIRLADEDNGEIPQEVIARVRIKNTSAVTEENVSLNGIPALSYHSASHALQALPVGVTGTLPDGTIGSLAPGAEAKLEYTVRAAGNGEFDFSPQVLSSDSVSVGTNVSQGVGTLTVLPTALLWLSLHRVNPGLIRAGLDTEISGTVTNHPDDRSRPARGRTRRQCRRRGARQRHEHHPARRCPPPVPGQDRTRGNGGRDRPRVHGRGTGIAGEGHLRTDRRRAGGGWKRDLTEAKPDRRQRWLVGIRNRDRSRGAGAAWSQPRNSRRNSPRQLQRRGGQGRWAVVRQRAIGSRRPDPSPGRGGVRDRQRDRRLRRRRRPRRCGYLLFRGCRLPARRRRRIDDRRRTR
jgi:hypothetical protein